MRARALKVTALICLGLIAANAVAIVEVGIFVAAVG